MSLPLNMNYISSAYGCSKEFIQNHKYKLAAGAAGISAIAIAALAIYSGRFSLPQSSKGKTGFILSASTITGGLGAIISGGFGVYKAYQKTKYMDAHKIIFAVAICGVGGAVAGGAAGAVLGSVGSSILLNR